MSFSPRGRIALILKQVQHGLFLKHYACCSDKLLIEQLNSNIDYQFYCDLHLGFDRITMGRLTTGYQMGIACVMLAIVSFFLGETWTSPLTWSTNIQWSMFLLIILGSLVAFTAFNYLLKEVSTEKVATASYVNPVVALFLGWYGSVT